MSFDHVEFCLFKDLIIFQWIKEKVHDHHNGYQKYIQ